MREGDGDGDCPLERVRQGREEKGARGERRRKHEEREEKEARKGERRKKHEEREDKGARKERRGGREEEREEPRKQTELEGLGGRQGGPASSERRVSVA